MNDNHDYIRWFRDASPYINAHRGKTFVFHLGGAAVSHPNFQNIIADISLLASLGVRLVLVHGSAPQINQQIEAKGLASDYVGEVRITTPDLLPLVLEATGKVRADIEARLSMGRPGAPQSASRMTVVSGNFIKAKPLGIVDGVDYHHTGAVRKVNTEALRQQLDLGATVLLSHTGVSPSGEIFNVNSAEVATEIAVALLADKLIFFTGEDGILDDQQQTINELPVSEITPSEFSAYHPLRLAHNACTRGVDRCQIISFITDGALLEELFTRDGSGTQVTRTSYEKIRPATPDDISGIVDLIAPLEEQGILVRRSRELLESEYDRFTVIERDGMIVSCAALYPFENKAELACLATHPDYRDNDRGELLMKEIETQARRRGFEALFVLTTHTVHWFRERGFRQIALDDLPASRKSLYNYQRNSRLLEKPLS